MNYASLLLLIQYLTVCLWGSSACAAETRDQGERAIRTSLKIMTFNIHWQGMDNGKFYDSGFRKRKPLIINVIKASGADVIGLQEASIEQRTALADALPRYGMFPLPSEVGDECILYRLDRLVLKNSGHENLRQKPEIPGTNIGVRGFFWVRLYDRLSDKQFYLLNLHTDHRSLWRGRQLDAILIGKWISKRKYSDPVILTGDFNGKPDNPRYLYLTGQKQYPDRDGKFTSMPVPMQDSFTLANPDIRYSGTGNFGYKGSKDGAQLDYIFVPRGTKVTGSRIIYYNANGAYPSDHYPVLSEIELN